MIPRHPAVDDASAQVSAARPSIFLMSNSFETGGSERQFVALAQSLDPARFDLHLGCIQRRGAFLEGWGEVPEFRLGGSLYGFHSWKTRRRLSSHLRKKRIALAHAFDFYTNLTLIPAATMAEIPVIIGSLRQLGDLLSRPKAYAQLAALQACDAVVCNSNAAVRRLLDQGLSKRKLVVIRNGLPVSAFAAAAPALPRTEGVLRVAMIARMNERAKNHALFLRALASLVSRLSAVEVLMVGDGPLRAELEHQTRDLGIAEHVKFLRERHDIQGILASVDVSVVPSSSESLSNVVLESMAAGLPVIASNVGGNPELVTPQTGLLVAPDDEHALADAIEHLLRNPALRRGMGRAAQTVAKANFTLEEMTWRHEELYAELLARKQPASSRSSSSRAAKTRLRLTVIAASPRFLGGQSVQAELLLRSWQDDPEVEASFIPIDPPWPAGTRWTSQIPFLRTLVRTPIYFFALYRGLKDADIAHIFAAAYWSFLLAPTPAWLMARSAGARTVIHYHSGEAEEHLQKSRITRMVLNQADRLGVPSEFLANVFRQFNLSAEIIPNLIDLSQFRFRERKPLSPRLLCTRGFHRYYGIDILVQAFAEVHRKCPEATLNLVGKGRTEKDIRNLVSKSNLSGVKFAGAVAWPEIARCYDAADVFINASWLDNQPVSIMEAFACGLPVVTTAPPGIRCMVEHERTGLLSEPNDAHALAENVMRLFREPELGSRLARNAYEEVQHYTWSTVREKWLALYRSMQ